MCFSLIGPPLAAASSTHKTTNLLSVKLPIPSALYSLSARRILSGSAPVNEESGAFVPVNCANFQLNASFYG